MRRQVKIVPSPSEFLEMVIFSGYLRIQAGLYVAAEAYGLSGYLGKFGKSIPVCIPGILGSVLAEDSQAELIVLRDNGGIDVSSVMKGRRTGYRGYGMGYARRIPDRLLCNDIDGACDGRRPEKSRSATSHNFHPVHHIGRKLLDSIDSGQ